MATASKPVEYPDWDTTEVNTTEPDTEHKEEGWLAPDSVPEKPPFEYFNYWQNNVFKWIQALNDLGVLPWDISTEYGLGSFAVGSDYSLYKSRIAGNTGNNPVGGDGTKWDTITEVPVIIHTGGGSVLVPFRVNVITDSLTYDFPTAANIIDNGWIIVEKLDVDYLETPTIQVTGSDTLTDRDGIDGDGDIILDQENSEWLRFLSDNTLDWRM